VSEVNRIKTVLGIDATGSMTDALDRTKRALEKAFGRIYETLKAKKVEQGF